MFWTIPVTVLLLGLHGFVMTYRSAPFVEVLFVMTVIVALLRRHTDPRGAVRPDLSRR
jgi:hypothetical protein